MDAGAEPPFLWAPAEGRDPSLPGEGEELERDGREPGVDESRLNGGDGRANPAGKQCRHGQAKVKTGRLDSVFGPVHGGILVAAVSRVVSWPGPILAMLKRGVGRSVSSRRSRKMSVTG